MKKNLFVLLALTLVIYSCKKNVVENNADAIINKSIEIAGGERFKNSTINFDFRKRHYKAIRNNGEFQFERQFKDSSGVITDVLSNSGFQRFLNDNQFKVHDTMARKYARSVNSVHYFSVLPYGLNDPAVNKTYVNKVTIKGGQYHKIKVTFNQTGGGEDFEDVFVYYVNAETFTIDYFSYLYYVDGGGKRFREAYNERYINGIRILDYNNYKPDNDDVSLFALDSLFESNSLKLLSKIEHENVTVE